MEVVKRCNRPQAWVSRPNRCASGCSAPNLWAGAGGVQLLSVQGQRHLLHGLPPRHLAEQGQPDHQPHRMLGGQLATPDRRLAGGLQGLFDSARIDQGTQLGHAAGGQIGQGLMQGGLQ